MSVEYLDITCINCGNNHELEVDDCYCDEDQGAGYTYNDEHGDCDNCEEVLSECPTCGKSMVYKV